MGKIMYLLSRQGRSIAWRTWKSSNRAKRANDQPPRAKAKDIVIREPRMTAQDLGVTFKKDPVLFRALQPLFGGPEDNQERQVGAQATTEQVQRTASIYPTPDEINALPEKVRRYIHDLATRTDKTGDVQTIAILREDRDALQRRVEELEAELKRVTKRTE